MKRDLDLCRQILLEVEEAENEGGWLEIELDGYTKAQIAYNTLLLGEAGLLIAKDLSSSDGLEVFPVRLTWQGHEFLESARDLGVWSKVKGTLVSKTSGLSFEVLKELLIQAAKNAVLGG